MDTARLVYHRSCQNEFYLASLPGDYILSIVKRSGSFYESLVLEKSLSLFGSPRLVIDVGANIGNHTIFWAGVLGARVHAFEPHPKIYQILCQNLERNSLQELVVPLNYALGAGESWARMVIPDENNLGTSRVVPREEEDAMQTAESRSRIRSLDSYVFEDVPRLEVDLLKIDTEGFELEVFKGAAETLSQIGPNLWVEIGASNKNQCFELLEKHGYRCLGNPQGGSDNYFFSKGRRRSFSNMRARLYGSWDRGQLGKVRKFFKLSC